LAERFCRDHPMMAPANNFEDTQADELLPLAFRNAQILFSSPEADELLVAQEGRIALAGLSFLVMISRLGVRLGGGVPSESHPTPDNIEAGYCPLSNPVERTDKKHVPSNSSKRQKHTYRSLKWYVTPRAPAG
jgi:hypothetical protein